MKVRRLLKKISDVIAALAVADLILLGCIETDTLFEVYLLWINALYVIMWGLANMDRLQGRSKVDVDRRKSKHYLRGDKRQSIYGPGLYGGILPESNCNSPCEDTYAGRKRERW